MSAESLTGLCEEADALALALACENRNVESDTVHRLAAKAKDLAGERHGDPSGTIQGQARSGRGGEVTYEYRVTHSSDSGGNFDNEPPVPPADSKGWRLHSHSTCYDTDGRTVRITYVWEREARP